MKTQRQAKIMEIISTRDIETQEQLLQALQDEGFYRLCKGRGGDLFRPAQYDFSGVHHQL